MTPLLAQDALCQRVLRVNSSMRPVGQNVRIHNLIYAVFSDNPKSASAECFLGLVSETAAARYPSRIFADLLPANPPEPVAATTPLHEILPRMDESGIDALPLWQPMAVLWEWLRAPACSGCYSNRSKPCWRRPGTCMTPSSKTTIGSRTGQTGWSV